VPAEALTGPSYSPLTPIPPLTLSLSLTLTPTVPPGTRVGAGFTFGVPLDVFVAQFGYGNGTRVLAWGL
jgi:hypothetical protein